MKKNFRDVRTLKKSNYVKHLTSLGNCVSCGIQILQIRLGHGRLECRWIGYGFYLILGYGSRCGVQMKAD